MQPQQPAYQAPVNPGYPGNYTGGYPVAPTPGFQPNPAHLAKPAGDSVFGMIVLVVMSVLVLVFMGLTVWLFIRWTAVSTDVQGQIDKAKAEAVDIALTKKEQEFEEREKSPYKRFSGPIDLGELSFEYPKTWNVYEANDARQGGDYIAYFASDKVPAQPDKAILRLRLTISRDSFDTTVKNLEKLVKKKKVELSIRPVNQQNANIYTGELTNKQQGRAAVFKMRDKTVIMQTDAPIFAKDFDKLLSTVTFNK